MQALYENTDGSYSVGVVVGRGLTREAVAYNTYQLRPSIQVRFEDTDKENGGTTRVETLFTDDRYLTLGVLYGSMCSALTKHTH